MAKANAGTAKTFRFIGPLLDAGEWLSPILNDETFRVIDYMCPELRQNCPQLATHHSESGGGLIATTPFIDSDKFFGNG